MTDQVTNPDDHRCWKVIDLGTKLGSAIGAFLKLGVEWFGKDVARIDPAGCLGIDRADKYRADVEKRGYAFQAVDLLQPEFK